jgi:hypothetical protein
MPPTVRQISDGEEMLLSAGEGFVVRSKPTREPVRSAVPNALAIKYLGFQNVAGRREYLLEVHRGDLARRYTVWIELTAFSNRQALLQEGPDICYQKLLHELADSELLGPDGIGVTEADLAAYRASHAVPARKSFSPSRTAAPAGPDAPGKTS